MTQHPLSLYSSENPTSLKTMGRRFPRQVEMKEDGESSPRPVARQLFSSSSSSEPRGFQADQQNSPSPPQTPSGVGVRGHRALPKLSKPSPADSCGDISAARKKKECPPRSIPQESPSPIQVASSRGCGGHLDVQDQPKQRPARLCGSSALSEELEPANVQLPRCARENCHGTRGDSNLSRNEPLRPSSFLPIAGNLPFGTRDYRPLPSGFPSRGHLSHGFVRGALPAPPPMPLPENFQRPSNAVNSSSALYEPPGQRIYHRNPHAHQRGYSHKTQISPNTFQDLVRAIGSHPTLTLILEKLRGSDPKDANPDAYTRCLEVETYICKYGMEKAKQTQDLLDLYMAAVLGATYFRAHSSMTTRNSIEYATENENPREVSTRVPLSDRAKRILEEFFNRNFDYPYPSTDEKRRLMAQTDLSRLQLDNWFSNKRQRAKRKVLRDAAPLGPRSKWRDVMLSTMGGPPEEGNPNAHRNSGGDNYAFDAKRSGASGFPAPSICDPSPGRVQRSMGPPVMQRSHTPEYSQYPQEPVAMRSSRAIFEGNPSSGLQNTSRRTTEPAATGRQLSREDILAAREVRSRALQNDSPYPRRT